MIQTFFSIVLPTFNRGRLISRAIESVLHQAFSEWELLIIDDGSRDDTFGAIRNYVLNDERIRYHFSRNRGLAMARNLGCSMARGNYFTFLDSDDEYREDHLQSRYNILSRTPAIELLHGGVEIIGDPYVADKFDPSKNIHIADCVVGGTFVIRRDLWQRLVGFRDVPYGDDNEFFERAREHGALIEKANKQTYRYYRTESDSLCAIVERDGIGGIENYRKQ